MLSILASTEHQVAQLLRWIASGLNRSADALDGAPIREVCRAALVKVREWDGRVAGGTWLIPIWIGVPFVFIAGTWAMFRYFSNDNVPILHPVPAPASAHDPACDPQCALFGQDDVRPQLVGPDVAAAIRATEPSTGALLGYVSGNTVDDVEKVVNKCRCAQKAWGGSSFERRRRVLRVLARYILKEQKAICKISARDSGKTLLEACMGEIIPTLEKLRWLISEGEDALKPSRRSVGPLTLHKVAQVEFSPIGVIGAIAPWNYPVHNILNPVSAALFSGCGIVVKPSEHTAWSAVHIIRIIRRALTVCGENAELVQCLIGEGDVAAQLVKSPGIGKIFFTGSTAIGRKVATAAAQRLTPTCLELGGKDACIVADDANLDHTVTLCLRGVFQNAGQNCIALERVYVHRNVKTEFVRRVADGARRIRVGVDMGAMTLGEGALAQLEGLIDDAVRLGARVVVGGKRASVDGGGCYFEATVLDGVTEGMRVAREEVFGPILCVLEWSDEQGLMEAVNGSAFGLGSSVFSEDAGRGERLLRRLDVGMCNVNDFATNYLCQSMPFGGTKDSGSDRFAGIEGLRGCCKMKSTTRDRFSAIKTSVPKALQYPVGVNAMELACEINELIYGNQIFGKLRNVLEVLALLILPSWRQKSTEGLQQK